MKPEADLRFVQVWNIPPDVLKKPLQWCFSFELQPMAVMRPWNAATFLVQAVRVFFGLGLLRKLRFVKKAGGSSANMAPVGAQLVMVKSPTANADARFEWSQAPKLVLFSLQARWLRHTVELAGINSSSSFVSSSHVSTAVRLPSRSFSNS